MGIAQYIAPRFNITLNGSSKHTIVVTSLQFIDYEKDNADTLHLTLAPTSKLPRFGDRIELFLGRDSLNFMGAFYVSSIKESYATNYSIEATSIDYTKEIKTKKSRTFSNISLKDMLSNIARENNLKHYIDFAYKDSIEYIEQVDESDSALLKRLADFYDCSFAIKNDTLIFKDRNTTFDRRTYSINANECTNLELESFASKQYKSLELFYTDNFGETRSVKVGNGEPIYKMTREAKDDTHALQMATTRLQNINTTKIKGSLSAIGRVIFAGGYLELALRGKKTKHIISQVTHNIDSKQWIVSLQFESNEL